MTLRVLVAPDSFGGWRSAPAVATQVARAVERAGMHAVVRPMSDGGEGLLDALDASNWLDGTTAVAASGPGGEPRRGRIGNRAGRPIIESSTWLRATAEAGPGHLSSHGLGQVLRACSGAPPILGLGGSSTVDLGLGVLAALGAQLLDGEGAPLPPLPASLHRLHTLRLAPDPALGWTVWADVDTPVALGAARFGPQKGVADVAALAAGWHRGCDVLDRWRQAHGRSPVPRDLPGGGAAGGLGFTLAALGARVVPGARSVAQAVLQDVDPTSIALVITGEGRLDATTHDQKVVAYLAGWARRHGVAFAAVVGASTPPGPALPGPVYVCDGSADRARALELALDRLRADLRDGRLTSRRGRSPRGAPAGTRTR